MKALKLLTTTLLALGVAQAYADQTNLVQNVSIQLLGVKEGRTVTNGSTVTTFVDTVRVDTRRVISAIGAATGYTFSLNSRLVLVTPQNGNSMTFEIRDGTAKVNVSQFFGYMQTSDSVTGSRVNTRTGRSFETKFSVQRLVLQNSDLTLGLHFDVGGYASQFNVNDRPGDDVNIDASGAGDRDGETLILRGSIRILGHGLEVVPDNTGGGGGVS